MSDDIYADDNLDVVQTSEIGDSGPGVFAPDLHYRGGLTHHIGADYGPADTTVTVVEGCQCVHDGVAHGSGETVNVPEAIGLYWVRSGWATADFDADAESHPGPGDESEPAPRVKPPTKAPSKQTAAGTRRRG